MLTFTRMLHLNANRFRLLMRRHIKIGNQLVRVKLLRISPTTHRRSVQLCESHLAYREGCKVSVGPGEFVADGDLAEPPSRPPTNRGSGSAIRED